MSATDGEVGARTRAALRANVYGTEYVLGELSAKVEGLERSIARLEAENAKLRELVRISIEFCANGMCGLYDGCPLNAADGRCRFDDRARELGVGFDG